MQPRQQARTLPWGKAGAVGITTPGSAALVPASADHKPLSSSRNGLWL